MKINRRFSIRCARSSTIRASKCAGAASGIVRPAARGSTPKRIAVLEAQTKKHYDTMVLPTMGTGATDMSNIRAKGIQCYGIGPALDTEDGAEGLRRAQRSGAHPRKRAASLRALSIRRRGGAGAGPVTRPPGGALTASSAAWDKGLLVLMVQTCVCCRGEHASAGPQCAFRIVIV